MRIGREEHRIGWNGDFYCGLFIALALDTTWTGAEKIGAEKKDIRVALVLGKVTSKAGDHSMADLATEFSRESSTARMAGGS